MNEKNGLSGIDQHRIYFRCAFTALLLVAQPVCAADESSKIHIYPGGYGNGYEDSRKPPSHSKAQINERREHCQADINILWQTSQRGLTTKSQLESTYSEFESALQKAGDELDTGERPKPGWAAELIT